VLFAGLGLSVILTGFAATLVAKLLQRLPWIGYVGLVVVLFVSGRMVWDGIVALGWLKMLGV
jgi:predicted tellurium resistance membrane protein TerC